MLIVFDNMDSSPKKERHARVENEQKCFGKTFLCFGNENRHMPQFAFRGPILLSRAPFPAATKTAIRPCVLRDLWTQRGCSHRGADCFIHNRVFRNMDWCCLIILIIYWTAKPSKFPEITYVSTQKRTSLDQMFKFFVAPTCSKQK